MSEEIHQQVLDTITRIENIGKTQTEIDSLWTEIKNLFLNEMKTLPDLPTSGNKKMKKKFRKSQPFWCQELDRLWVEACQAEKSYLNFKVLKHEDNVHKDILRQNFKNSDTVNESQRKRSG